jgi:hypothetical protein
MPRKKAPELTFQQHLADYLIREHKYGKLEQATPSTPSPKTSSGPFSKPRRPTR